MTEAPVANFCANSFDAFLRSTPVFDMGDKTDVSALNSYEPDIPNVSKPCTEVTYLRLFRSIRLIVIYATREIDK